MSTKLSRNITLSIPFISANMDTVTEAPMAVTMARAGGIGILHRFLTIQEQAKEVLKVKRAGSVIIENPYTINQEKTVQDAIDYADEQEVSGLLVVDSNSKLVGIVTDRDLLFEKDTSHLIKDVMTKDVVTAKPGITSEEAKEILHKNRIEKLPTITIFQKLPYIWTLIHGEIRAFCPFMSFKQMCNIFLHKSFKSRKII